VSRSNVYKWHKRFSKRICRTLRGLEDLGYVKIAWNSTFMISSQQTKCLRFREDRSMCGVSKSSIFKIPTKNFEMSHVCARWVPRLLSDDHKNDEWRQVKLSLCYSNVKFFNVRLGRAACIHMVNGKYADFWYANMHCANFYKFNVLSSILKFYHTFLLLTLLYREKIHMSTNFLDNPRIQFFVFFSCVHSNSHVL
jgi:hypothetical protein